MTLLTSRGNDGLPDEIQRLQKIYYNMKMKEGDDLERHLDLMMKIEKRLSDLKSPIGAERQIISILTSLPRSWRRVSSMLLDNPTIKSVKLLCAYLLEEEMKRTQKKKSFA